MPLLSKYLLAAGIILSIAGVLYWLLPAAFSWFGKLPGDIHIQKKEVSIYIPLVSMLVVSVLLSVLLTFLGKFLK
jgi:hypothetical protein